MLASCEAFPFWEVRAIFPLTVTASVQTGSVFAGQISSATVIYIYREREEQKTLFFYNKAGRNTKIVRKMSNQLHSLAEVDLITPFHHYSIENETSSIMRL